MLLNRDLARALDPLEFAHDCGITPDGWQADLLTSPARKSLILCSRQAGKSTTSSILALHIAAYQPGSLVLLASPSQRQSSELFRKVTDHLRHLDDGPEIAMESTLRLELRNRSRIVALPGSDDTVRGYSGAAAVIVDEAARVPDGLIAAIRPILATSGGRLICLTTPAGKRGWFYQEWRGGEGWHRIKVTADQIPRITPEFLADERKSLGQLMYSQEYECEFVDDGTQIFPSHLIEQCLVYDMEPLFL